MPAIFRASVVSHVAAIALGAVAATAIVTTYSANSQSLADYISAICAKPFRSASAAEAPYLAENVSAMTKMMIDMGIRPSGDVDIEEEPGRRSAAKLLTKDEARRIAANVVKLSDYCLGR